MGLTHPCASAVVVFVSAGVALQQMAKRAPIIPDNFICSRLERVCVHLLLRAEPYPKEQLSGFAYIIITYFWYGACIRHTHTHTHSGTHRYHLQVKAIRDHLEFAVSVMWYVARRIAEQRDCNRITQKKEREKTIASLIPSIRWWDEPIVGMPMNTETCSTRNDMENVIGSILLWLLVVRPTA